MAEELTKKKRMRAGHKGVARKMLVKVKERLSEDQAGDSADWFLQASDSLKEKRKTLTKLNEEVLELLMDVEGADIEKEIAECDDFSAEIGEVIIKLDALKTSNQSAFQAQSSVQNVFPSPNLNDSITSSTGTGTHQVHRVKLPKLKIAKFDGTINKWQEFWDTFESSIDKNEELSDVDKFAYLRGLLEGTAKSTIAGFSLTAANYGSAVELMKNRYGKTSVIQRSHIKELMKLQPVFRENDIPRLRKLYDNCETHIRGLKALGVDEASYEAIVVPAIMEKLPETFRLTITRGSEFLSWSIQDMLKAFLAELELKEQHLAMTSTKENGQLRDRKGVTSKPYTATALLAQREGREARLACAFCLKAHKP